jgi:arsenite-transporting ATPase
VERLRDPKTTTFYIVARADKHSLAEAARTTTELAALGMTQQKLLINGVLEAQDASDPVANKIVKLASRVISDLPADLLKLERSTFPLLPYNVLGLEKLRSLLDPAKRLAILEQVQASETVIDHHLPSIEQLVNDIVAGENHGLIMTMGKGGVGKTISAAAIATLLARKGHAVHLTTTDPAAHIHEFMAQLRDLPGNATVHGQDHGPKGEKPGRSGKTIARRRPKIPLHRGSCRISCVFQSHSNGEAAVCGD